MSEARIPSPADWDLEWADLALILKDIPSGSARTTALMNRFYITQRTAAAWLEGLRLWEGKRVTA